MKIGQLVLVKTNGLKNVPIMQVKRIEEAPISLKADDDSLQDEITCFWFDANSVYREKIFTVNELEVYEEPAPIAFG